MFISLKIFPELHRLFGQFVDELHLRGEQKKTYVSILT